MDSIPRPGTIVYDLIYGDDEQEKIAIRKFQLVNAYIVVPLYRIGLLPIIGFSRIFLLLETVGRKTGVKRTTPLEYHRINGVIHIISARGERSDWFKNLQKNPGMVSVKLGFHSFRPQIRIIDDPKEKLEVLRWYVTTHPTLAKHLIGWNRRTDDVESGLLNPLVKLFQIIRLYEEKQGSIPSNV